MNQRPAAELLDLTPHLKPHERIILPLDTSDAHEAFGLVNKFKDKVGLFKFGLQLLFSRNGGARFLDVLADRVGADRLMVDAKLNDIPNTMRGAIASILGPAAKEQFTPRFLTVHAEPGVEHLAACVDAAGPNVGIVAITVLSSEDDDSWRRNGKRGSVRSEIFRRIENARDAKCSAIVCGAEDLEAVKIRFVDLPLFKITPSVRPDWAAKNDQKRSATPGQAYAHGADYLVIGRPITNPPSEVGLSEKAIELISEEIAEAKRIPRPDPRPDPNYSPGF